MTQPIRLCWWGPETGTIGWLGRQAQDALARRDDVRVTRTAPAVVLIGAADLAATAPAASCHIYYPWGDSLPDGLGLEVPLWAASRWHQKMLPGSRRVPVGAWLHEPRPVPPEDGGVIVVVGPDAHQAPAPLLERFDGAVLWCWQTGDAALSLEPEERRALWAVAAVVVLLPGCEASLSLAIEARSVGVPVLVPKGDPADELLMVPGIGAYGVHVGDVPRPDWAALCLRIDRLAGQDFTVRPADLSGWHWDCWAERVVAGLRELGVGADSADGPLAVAVTAADAGWLAEQVLRPALQRPQVPVDVLVIGDLPAFATGLAAHLSGEDRDTACPHVRFWPVGPAPAEPSDPCGQVAVRLAGPAVTGPWADWAYSP
jgi:hypothetical protein